MSTIGINGLTFFNNTGAELDVSALRARRNAASTTCPLDSVILLVSHSADALSVPTKCKSASI